LPRAREWKAKQGKVALGCVFVCLLGERGERK